MDGGARGAARRMRGARPAAPARCGRFWRVERGAAAAARRSGQTAADGPAPEPLPAQVAAGGRWMNGGAGRAGACPGGGMGRLAGQWWWPGKRWPVRPMAAAGGRDGAGSDGRLGQRRWEGGGAGRCRAAARSANARRDVAEPPANGERWRAVRPAPAARSSRAAPRTGTGPGLRRPRDRPGPRSSGREKLGQASPDQTGAFCLKTALFASKLALFASKQHFLPQNGAFPLFLQDSRTQL